MVESRALSFNKEYQSLWLYTSINNHHASIPAQGSAGRREEKRKEKKGEAKEKGRKKRRGKGGGRAEKGGKEKEKEREKGGKEKERERERERGGKCRGRCKVHSETPLHTADISAVCSERTSMLTYAD